MIDIFEEKPQPKVYIVDIEVDVLIPTRSKKVKKFDKVSIKLEKYPMTLVDDKIPTKKLENQFFYSVYSKHIGRNDFSKMIFKISSIKNIKFSSNLGYKFDYSIH